MEYVALRLPADLLREEIRHREYAPAAGDVLVLYRARDCGGMYANAGCDLGHGAGPQGAGALLEELTLFLDDDGGAAEKRVPPALDTAERPLGLGELFPQVVALLLRELRAVKHGGVVGAQPVGGHISVRVQQLRFAVLEADLNVGNDPKRTLPAVVAV